MAGRDSRGSRRVRRDAAGGRVDAQPPELLVPTRFGAAIEPAVARLAVATARVPRSSHARATCMRGARRSFRPRSSPPRAETRPPPRRHTRTGNRIAMRPRGDGARGTRTPDLLGAIQALSQLSYSPERGRQDSGPCRQRAIVAATDDVRRALAVTAPTMSRFAPHSLPQPAAAVLRGHRRRPDDHDGGRPVPADRRLGAQPDRRAARAGADRRAGDLYASSSAEAGEVARADRAAISGSPTRSTTTDDRAIQRAARHADAGGSARSTSQLERRRRRARSSPAAAGRRAAARRLLDERAAADRAPHGRRCIARRAVREPDLRR